MSTFATRNMSNNENIPFKIWFKDNRDFIGLRLHIVKVGVLTDGLLTINVTANSQTIATVTKTYQDINLLGTNWHGMLSLPFSAPVPIRIDPTIGQLEVTITATMSSHTDNSTKFIAIVHESDLTVPLVHIPANPYYPTYGSDPASDVWHNSFGMEIYTAK
jgi:hypothetical protein